MTFLNLIGHLPRFAHKPVSLIISVFIIYFTPDIQRKQSYKNFKGVLAPKDQHSFTKVKKTRSMRFFSIRRQIAPETTVNVRTWELKNL